MENYDDNNIIFINQERSMDKIIQKNNTLTSKIFVFFIVSFIILIALISATLFLKHVHINNFQYAERTSQQAAKALEQFGLRVKALVNTAFTGKSLV